MADTFYVGHEMIEVADGTDIGLYNAQRSMIDVFRMGHRQCFDVAIEALNRWLRRRNSSPAELVRMAHNFPKALPAIRAAREVLL